MRGKMTTFTIDLDEQAMSRLQQIADSRQEDIEGVISDALNIVSIIEAKKAQGFEVGFRRRRNPDTNITIQPPSHKEGPRTTTVGEVV